MVRARRLVLALVFAVLAGCPPVATASQPLSCASFQDAQAAQDALQANPAAAAALDVDGDGHACEEVFDAEPGDAGPIPSGFPLIFGPDVDCVDLIYQEIAQNVLERNPDDPFNLDTNGDGFACSSLPSLNTLPTQSLAAPAVPPTMVPVAVPAPVDVPLTPEPTASPVQSKNSGKKAKAANTKSAKNAGRNTENAAGNPATASVSGVGKAVSESFSLQPGRYRVTATVQVTASSGFICQLYGPEGGPETLFNELIDTPQAWTASTVLTIDTGGEFHADVSNTVEPWTLTFAPL